MIISVTQKHIDKGDQSSRTCPVALALKEAIPEFEFIVTTLGITAYIPDCDESNTSIPTSESINHFIGRFDNYKPVKPFKFKI